MHKFRRVKGKRAWVALKLDMEKAYDRLEWPFIQKCLEKLGFQSRWIQRTMECITSVSYSLLVNDEPPGLIQPTRGIRQGDPLSPYIFILCMEALSNALIKESLEQKSGIGIKLSTSLERIPCLLFADDCLLFCRADATTCTKLKSLLESFCAHSGQLINYHKSTLTFSTNATTSHRRLATSIFNITHSDSLGKYLGCPIFQKNPSTVTFQELVDKAMTNLAGWKANCLSKAGRAVFIQSHLETLPAHTMQCFRPSTISNNIDRVSREFFWKKNNIDKGLPLVAWDKVCRPKKHRGLGLQKTAAVNQAFQCKLAWKILTKQNSMWVRIMCNKYLAHQGFFDAHAKQGDSVV